MSRSAALAVLPVCALLVTACGSSDPAPTTKASPSASAAPVTKAQAEATAKAINLVASDLGAGYKASPHEDNEDDASDKAIEDQLNDCFGADVGTDEDPVGSATSDDFSVGEVPNGREVYSETEVVESDEQARQELALLNSDKAPACLQKAFSAAITDLPAGVSVKPLEVSPSTQIAGNEDSFSFTITSAVVGPGVEVPLAFTFDGFLVKRTTVTLFTSSFGQAFPQAERAKLQATLLARAQAKAL